MGIRFLCPQGHIINVKDFLAGKKGVCPDCGAKVLIPAASTHRKDGTPLDKSAAVPVGAASAPPLSAAAPLNAPAQLPAVPTPAKVATPAAPVSAAPIVPAAAPMAPAGVPTGAAVAPVAVVPAAVPAAVPLGAVATAVKAVPISAVPYAGSAAPVAAIPMAGAVPVGATAIPMGAAAVPVAAVPYGGVPVAAVRPALNPGGPMPPGLVDPIAEAPNATWYIRPAAGGQFGPARADVLRQWMQEGRLAADTHVWREGWPDWMKAGLIFPQLAENAPPAAVEEFVKTETSKTTAANYVARKKSGNSTGIVMIVVLGLICIGLGIALVVLLPKMK